MTWAEEMRAFLALTKLSQERFARLIDVSHATVNRWCQGERTPPTIVRRSVREFMERYEPEEQER